MGQYFLLVNVDRKEYVDPFFVGGGSGYKLWEWCTNNTTRVIPFLIRKSSSIGCGGDLLSDSYKYAGRWAGDRIVLVGDYDDSGLFTVAEDSYENISKEVREEFNRFIEVDDLKLSTSWFVDEDTGKLKVKKEMIKDE